MNSPLNRGETKLVGPCSGGTETHLCIVDVRQGGLDGVKAEAVLDDAFILTNAMFCPGQTVSDAPGGLRIGTPFLTTRGFDEDDFRRVGGIFVRALQIARTLNDGQPSTSDFKERMKKDMTYRRAIEDIRRDVTDLAHEFPLPGAQDI